MSTVPTVQGLNIRAWIKAGGLFKQCTQKEKRGWFGASLPFRWSETRPSAFSSHRPTSHRLVSTCAVTPQGNVVSGKKMKAVCALVMFSCWAAVLADHSIMEIINTDRVKKLIAQQQLNASRDFLPTPFSTNSVSDYPEETDEIAPHKTGKRRGRNRPKPADFSTVLKELTRADQVQASGPGMLVTKKTYVRKDWCKTEPIVQTIREEGCLPKNIVNRFCYGQCNSFFIPKNLSGRVRKRRLEEWDDVSTFRSCGVCKPKKSTWVQVTLDCPGTETPLRRRKVHKIKQCQCMALNVAF